MSESILVNKSVLVVEDNAINKMVVKHALMKLGASADIASDGTEAIEKLKISNYDLILMDVQMPNKDGYETTDYIRTQLKSSVPIIAMTAFALNGEDERCYEHGMNGYVSKPFTIESLSNIIQKVLSVPVAIINNPYILGNKDVAIDVSMLYDISGNDHSYIHTMVHTFLGNMPLTLKKMDESLKMKDWENLYKAAHYAKSSLSVIKIGEMFDWLVTVEGNAKRKASLDSLPELVEKIKVKFSMAEKVLSEKFGVPVLVQ
jgi:CheY-like chemotaxis protein/HPt (histidine-containing phosphotransfer) domain-containing protein